MVKFKIFVTDNCAKCNEYLNYLEVNKIPLEYEIIKSDDKLNKQFRITVAPTTILMDESGEIDRFYGCKDQEYIKKFLKLNNIC